MDHLVCMSGRSGTVQWCMFTFTILDPLIHQCTCTFVLFCPPLAIFLWISPICCSCSSHVLSTVLQSNIGAVVRKGLGFLLICKCVNLNFWNHSCHLLQSNSDLVVWCLFSPPFLFFFFFFGENDSCTWKWEWCVYVWENVIVYNQMLNKNILNEL